MSKIINGVASEYDMPDNKIILSEFSLIKDYTILTNEIIEGLKEELKLKDGKISKAIEYIKENTKYYDSEYSRIYSELCDCAGLYDTRIHVVVGDNELLEILESEN